MARRRGEEGRGNEFKKFARFVLLFFRRGNFPPSIRLEISCCSSSSSSSSSSIVRNEFSSQDILNRDLNRFQPRQRKRLSYCTSFNLFDYRYESRILLRTRFDQRELERIIQFCSNSSSRYFKLFKCIYIY